MSTGWKWITSDGQEFRSHLYARNWLRDNPEGTVTFSELSMAGVKLTDVTEEFSRSLVAALTDSKEEETLHIDGCTLPGNHEGPCDV